MRIINYLGYSNSLSGFDKIWIPIFGINTTEHSHFQQNNSNIGGDMRLWDFHKQLSGPVSNFFAVMQFLLYIEYISI